MIFTNTCREEYVLQFKRPKILNLSNPENVMKNIGNCSSSGNLASIIHGQYFLCPVVFIYECTDLHTLTDMINRVSLSIG